MTTDWSCVRIIKYRFSPIYVDDFVIPEKKPTHPVPCLLYCIARYRDGIPRVLPYPGAPPRPLPSSSPVSSFSSLSSLAISTFRASDLLPRRKMGAFAHVGVVCVGYYYDETNNEREMMCASMHPNSLHWEYGRRGGVGELEWITQRLKEKKQTAVKGKR